MFRPLTSFRLVLSLILIASIVEAASGAQYFVRKTGDDNRSGRNRRQAFQTIGKATSVARAGDVIYIGAGNYDESLLINGAGGGSSWLILLADRNGFYTGDRGAVTIRSSARTWACRIYNSQNVLFYGVNFSSQDSGSAGYGCLSANTSGYTYYLNCQFENLLYSLRDVGQHTLYVSRCTFKGGQYGIYSTGIAGAVVSASTFRGVGYGCVHVDGNRLTVSQSQFTSRRISGGDATTTRGVYAVRTALDVSRCRFEETAFGVYGTSLESGAVRRCEFQDSASYAVRCDGESLSMSDSNVFGGNYGITLGDTGGKNASLSNVTVEGTRVGVTAHQSDYDFRNVVLRENTYGLYQRSGNQLLTLTRNDSVQFERNQYGILTNHRDGEDATLRVESADFTNNDRGIVSYRTTVEIDECQFGGAKLGAYLWENPAVSIEDSQFFGNPSDPNLCSYGLYVRSGKISIHDASSRNARYGVMIHNTSDRPPKISDLVSSNHTVAALYMRDGVWSYDGADNNSFTDSPRGVMAHTVDWAIRNVTTGETCDYPIMDYYGKCTMSDVVANGKTSGFYAYQSQSIDATRLTVRDAKSYGIRINDCMSVRLDQCQSLGNGHGAYLYSTRGLDPQITSSTFNGNAGYGLLMSGVTLDPDTTSGLEFRGNRYGVRVNNRELSLTPAMRVLVTENQYGVLCQNESLSLAGVDILGNQIGAYLTNGGLSVSDCVIDATSYGVIASLSDSCSITQSDFSGGAYGIYLRSIQTLPEEIEIRDVDVDRFATCGIYVRGAASHSTDVRISDCRLREGARGIVTSNVSFLATNVSMSNLSSIGIYQTSGIGEIRGCSLSGLPGSWAVLARGERCDVFKSIVRDARYGISLQTSEGAVVNSLIAGTNYGLYLLGNDADYSVLQTTVADARYYGLLRYQGNTTVRNCIFDASYYGIYDGKRGGVFDHQANVVFADYRPYRNCEPGLDEIAEPPLFVDESSGDFHLAAGSPAINSGADLTGVISSDLEGNARPSYRGFEMGAYEYMFPSGSLRVIKWDEVAR